MPLRGRGGDRSPSSCTAATATARTGASPASSATRSATRSGRAPRTSARLDVLRGDPPRRRPRGGLRPHRRPPWCAADRGARASSAGAVNAVRAAECRVARRIDDTLAALDPDAAEAGAPRLTERLVRTVSAAAAARAGGRRPPQGPGRGALRPPPPDTGERVDRPHRRQLPAASSSPTTTSTNRRRQGRRLIAAVAGSDALAQMPTSKTPPTGARCVSSFSIASQQDLGDVLDLAPLRPCPRPSRRRRTSRSRTGTRPRCARAPVAMRFLAALGVDLLADVLLHPHAARRRRRSTCPWCRCAASRRGRCRRASR